VQSEQLPTEGQIFEDEVLAGAKRADEREYYRNYRNSFCAKSFILQMYDVLARHRLEPILPSLLMPPKIL
jgi:hypothetical protein